MPANVEHPRARRQVRSMGPWRKPVRTSRVAKVTLTAHPPVKPAPHPDRARIDTQISGPVEIHLLAQDPPHSSHWLQLDNGADFGRQLRQNLCLGPPYHDRGTKAMGKLGEIRRPAQVPSKPVVMGAAITTWRIETTGLLGHSVEKAS